MLVYIYIFIFKENYLSFMTRKLETSFCLTFSDIIQLSKIIRKAILAYCRSSSSKCVVAAAHSCNYGCHNFSDNFLLYHRNSNCETYASASLTIKFIVIVFRVVMALSKLGNALHLVKNAKSMSSAVASSSFKQCLLNTPPTDVTVIGNGNNLNQVMIG